MRPHGLVLLAWAMLAAPAVAADSTPPERTVTAFTTDIDHEVRIAAYVQFRSRNCVPDGAPSIEIVTKPNHGSVSLRPGPILVKESRSGDCVGYTFPGVNIWYTPAAGFSGADRFDYDVFFTKDTRHNTATIDVK
jgi:hypothetical protein